MDRGAAGESGAGIDGHRNHPPRADHSLGYNPLTYRDQVAADVIRRMEGDCTIVTSRDTRITITADDLRALLTLCSVNVTRSGRLRAHYTKKAPNAAPTAGGRQPNQPTKEENN